MLADEITRYIELHRAMGFAFRTQAYLLHHFSRFAEACADHVVRTQTVLAWSAQAPSAGQRRLRLLVIRRFARLMQAENAHHEIPPADAFGRPLRERRTPHLYTPEDIQRLLAAAAQLTPKGSLRPATYVSLFSLLACTGLRISEALKLQLEDVTQSGLFIRQTKFRTNRYVPLPPTAQDGLGRFLARRRQVDSNDRAVFISLWGTRLAYSTVCAVFLKLTRCIALRGGPGTPGPCMHDFRHTFAVRALEACRGGKEEITRHLLALSTYLGHTHPSDTYYYLQTTPRLMEGISHESEALFRGGSA